MTVRAKTLVKDKFWIVEQNGQKLGTLQKKENNGWVYLNKAEKEMEMKDKFDHIIINNDLNKSKNQFVPSTFS